MIRRQVVMPVSPQRLWDALTDPDEVAGWMGGRLDWELEEGAVVRFHGDDGHDRVGLVETVRPGRHLRFRWWPASGESEEPDESVVTYLLEEDADGTRLTVQETRVDIPAGPAGPAGPRACAGGPGGWSEWDRRLLGVWASRADAALARA